MPIKGIILAGGNGSRLYPATASVSKQLLTVYDKPMIYYPLANMMSAGIREICIVTNPENITHFRKLLNDGSQWGISIEYLSQESPDGIPQAFLIAENFLEDNNSLLILGDNILIGSGLGRKLGAYNKIDGCQVFAYEVEDPTKYGNIKFNANGSINKIVEKPKEAHSRFVVPGIYFFDNSVISRAKKLKKSKRGEFEIVDLINSYSKDNKLEVSQLSRGTVWIDTGNPKDLASASEYVRVLQERQGRYIACLEEIALRWKWINEKSLKNFKSNIQSPYAIYVRQLSISTVLQEPNQI